MKIIKALLLATLLSTVASQAFAENLHCCQPGPDCGPPYECVNNNPSN